MNVKKINNNFEPYKRVVKFVGSAIIVLLELAAYYYVWMNCYNRNMTVAFWRRGNWLIAGEYLILSLQEADNPVLKAFGIDPDKNVTIHEIEYL